MSDLFSPLTLRGLTLRNRVVMSPMCQYSSEDGFANDWHLVHLGSRAVGGAGLVLTEATAVVPEGRISPQDLGIWKDAHIEMLARIAAFVKGQGAAVGIQLAHAGRKGSTRRPWDGDGAAPPDEGGWSPVPAPSAIRFADTYPEAAEMTVADIQASVRAFADAADRALQAGFLVAEIHGAHGYLLHQFLSPLSNRRTDAYGGSFENRTRFIREVASAVRDRWPEQLPLFVRLSATDWMENGWDVAETVELARALKELGVDLIDVSTGGAVPNAKIPVGAGYQVPFAERVRREAAIPTGAVGMITEPMQAETILRTGQADLVLLARELLRDPYWPLHAANPVRGHVEWPAQYERAKPRLIY